MTSQMWGDLTDPLRFGESPNDLLLVFAINPVYLEYAGKLYAPQWIQAARDPDYMCQASRPFPSSLISPDHLVTFGPTGAIVEPAIEHVGPGKANGIQAQQYAGRHAAPYFTQGPADPNSLMRHAIPERHTEIMLWGGPGIKVSGYFVKRYAGHVVDHVGEQHVASLMNKYNRPITIIDESLPANSVEATDQRITVTHDGFTYILHDSRYPDNVSWRGLAMPYANYQLENFPSPDGADEILRYFVQNGGDSALASQCQQQYLAEDFARMAPTIQQAHKNRRDEEILTFTTGYGADERTISLRPDGKATTMNHRQAVSRKAWADSPIADAVEISEPPIVDSDTLAKVFAVAITCAKSELSSVPRLSLDKATKFFHGATQAPPLTSSRQDVPSPEPLDARHSDSDQQSTGTARGAKTASAQARGHLSGAFGIFGGSARPNTDPTNPNGLINPKSQRPK